MITIRTAEELARALASSSIDPNLRRRLEAQSSYLADYLDDYAFEELGLFLIVQLEAVGAWKPGKLARLSYIDRYLNAPLPLLLCLRTCEALAADLKAQQSLQVDVLVQQLKTNRGPYRIFDDWELERDREEVAQSLGQALGLDVKLQVEAKASHGRKLVLEYVDGQKVLILLDQGFGYWRVVGKPPLHNFRAAPTTQASELVRSNGAVSGIGESYFAITRL